jgi:hypothetical protein
VAGDKLNNDIIAYIRSEFKILIGEKTAEEIKISIGSVMPDQSMEVPVKGRDLVTGLPREVIITDGDIREAMAQSMANLVETVKEVLETTPPEIVSDIMQRGIYLVGGGALIRGLDVLLKDELKIPVYIASDPLTAIARGTGIILENLDDFIEFKNQRLIIRKNNLNGLFSLDNNEFLPIEFQFILPRKNDRFILWSKKSIFGLSDINGKIIIPLQYKSISSTVNDDFYITENGKNLNGVYDYNGKNIIPEEFKFYTVDKYRILATKDNKSKIIVHILFTVKILLVHVFKIFLTSLFLF